MFCKPIDTASIGQPGDNKMALSEKDKVREGAGNPLQHFRNLAAVHHTGLQTLKSNVRQRLNYGKGDNEI